MKLLLFDVDLTLVSTGGASLRALDRAFEEILGIPGAIEGVRPHGKTDPAIVREVCSKRKLADVGDLAAFTVRVLGSYFEFLKDEVVHSDKYRVLPGVRDILDEAGRREDVMLGLATGNVESGARIKLERGGLNGYFSFGGFGSDSEDRTEVVAAAARRASALGASATPNRTFVIGDTPRDVLAGKAAGFRTIAVGTGNYSIEALRVTGADLVIEDLEVGRDQFWGTTRIV